MDTPLPIHEHDIAREKEGSVPPLSTAGKELLPAIVFVFVVIIIVCLCASKSGSLWGTRC